MTIRVVCGDIDNGGRPYGMMIQAVSGDRDIGSCVCVCVCVCVSVIV